MNLTLSDLYTIRDAANLLVEIDADLTADLDALGDRLEDVLKGYIDAS